MSDPDKKVICGEHGEAYATFVCRHLVRGSNLGFFCADDLDDPYPHAWCAECDKILLEEGEWNDRSEGFAQVTMICSGCYEAARSRNAR